LTANAQLAAAPVQRINDYLLMARRAGEDLRDAPTINVRSTEKFADQLAAARSKVSDLVAQYDDALSDDDRDRRLSDIAVARLEAERREEAIIEAAAADGMTVPRRADADPRALLGVVAH
jgi:hypothetical protein